MYLNVLYEIRGIVCETMNEELKLGIFECLEIDTEVEVVVCRV